MYAAHWACKVHFCSRMRVIARLGSIQRGLGCHGQQWRRQIIGTDHSRKSMVFRATGWGFNLSTCLMQLTAHALALRSCGRLPEEPDTKYKELQGEAHRRGARQRRERGGRGGGWYWERVLYLSWKLRGGCLQPCLSTEKYVRTTVCSKLIYMYGLDNVLVCCIGCIYRLSGERYGVEQPLCMWLHVGVIRRTLNYRRKTRSGEPHVYMFGSCNIQYAGTHNETYDSPRQLQDKIHMNDYKVCFRSWKAANILK